MRADSRISCLTDTVAPCAVHAMASVRKVLRLLTPQLLRLPQVHQHIFQQQLLAWLLIA
jgi:hypothetical protein